MPTKLVEGYWFNISFPSISWNSKYAHDMNHVEYHMAQSQAWHHIHHGPMYRPCTSCYSLNGSSHVIWSFSNTGYEASFLTRWLGETLFGVDLHLCCNEDIGWQVTVSKVHVHVAWIHNRIWEWIYVYKPGKGACLFKAILSSNTYWILLLHINSLSKLYAEGEDCGTRKYFKH